MAQEQAVRRSRTTSFTIRQLEREKGIPRSLTAKAIARGDLRAHQVGERAVRVFENDFDDWLERCRIVSDSERTHLTAQDLVRKAL